MQRRDAKNQAIGRSEVQAELQPTLAQQYSLLIARHLAIADELIDEFPQLAEYRNKLLEKLGTGKDIDPDNPE